MKKETHVFKYRKDGKIGHIEVPTEILGSTGVTDLIRGDDTHRSKISLIYEGIGDDTYIYDAVYPDVQHDKLCITEILNDLHRNGFVRGGKAETMLRDWAVELRERASVKHPPSRLKRTFKKLVGIENW